MSTNLKALPSPRSLNTLLRRESSNLPLPLSRLTRKLSSLLHLRLIRRNTLLLRSLHLLFPLHPATSLSKVAASGAWEEIIGLLFAATEFAVPGSSRPGTSREPAWITLPLPIYHFMRARPSYLRAFVPLSDDFTSHQNRRRNAILVDVLPPANLGRFSQDTIANELANRFGGYPNDFHVARYSERDYVLFLPEWVPTKRLIRRDVLNLGAFRLRCFPWNPYRGAHRPPLTYKAWIRLVSLPYECRSSRSMAALVGDFGRFIRPNDFSARMADLSGCRCLIAVNHLSDIPKNLEITFGDLSISVLIQLVGRGNPPNEHADQHIPHERSSARDLHAARSDHGRYSSDGGDSNSNTSWNSSEIHDRRRALHPFVHRGRRASPARVADPPL